MIRKFSSMLPVIRSNFVMVHLPKASLATVFGKYNTKPNIKISISTASGPGNEAKCQSQWLCCCLDRNSMCRRLTRPTNDYASCPPYPLRCRINFIEPEFSWKCRSKVLMCLRNSLTTLWIQHIDIKVNSEILSSGTPPLFLYHHAPGGSS